MKLLKGGWLRNKCQCLCFIAFALLAVPGWGQRVTGDLDGRVLDANGQAIATANIAVSGPNLQNTRVATSDQWGYFQILSLPTGFYTVEVTHAAYRSVTYELF